MMLRQWLLCLVGLVGLTLSCSSDQPQSAEEALEDKGVLEVLDEAAEDEYSPPENGFLTADQVAMYIKVREREIELLEVASQRFQESAAEVKESEEQGNKLDSLLGGLEALKGLSEVLTTDIRAAQELGYNTEEYQWVKGQILLAEITVQSADFEKKMANIGSEEGQKPAPETEESAEVNAARHNLKLIGDQKERIDELNRKAAELYKNKAAK